MRGSGESALCKGPAVELADARFILIWLTGMFWSRGGHGGVLSVDTSRVIMNDPMSITIPLANCGVSSAFPRMLVVFAAVSPKKAK